MYLEKLYLCFFNGAPWYIMEPMNGAFMYNNQEHIFDYFNRDKDDYLEYWFFAAKKYNFKSIYTNNIIGKGRKYDRP